MFGYSNKSITFDYKKEKPFEDRLQESTKVKGKYSNKVPIVVTKTQNCKLPDIDRNKYLVSDDMVLSQFLYTIRKRIKLESSEALFFFIGDVVPNNSVSIGELYNLHKDKDGFLYITYNSENTFG